MKKLEPRQKRFVQEYLVDLNATRAAIRAGYSKKTAQEQSARLLSKAIVKRMVKAAMEKREERTEITAARVLEELAIVGFSDLRNYIDIDPDTGAIRAKGFDEMLGNSSRALEAVKENRVIKEDADGKKSTVYDKVEFKLHSKNQALELLGKHLGLFPTKLDAPGLEDALNRHAMSIEALRKSWDAYKGKGK